MVAGTCRCRLKKQPSADAIVVGSVTVSQCHTALIELMVSQGQSSGCVGRGVLK